MTTYAQMDPSVTVTIPVGAVGVDFSEGFPAPLYLREHGVSFVMMYLKYWKQSYVQFLIDSGIAVGAIQESASASALLGAGEGQRQARLAISWCRQYGIPLGHPVMFCHDTGAFTSKVTDFFEAAEHDMRSAGYGFAGYVTKTPYEAALRRGVVFDQTVCPGGYKMNGDQVRSVGANSWQHPSSRTFLPGYDVDKQDVKRPMLLWGKPAAVPPVQQPDNSRPPIINTPPGREPDMPNIATNIVTNKEARTNEFDGLEYPAYKFVFIVEPGGLLRHVDGRLPEGALYPIDVTTPAFTNAQLDSWPKYAAPVAAVHPFGVSGSFSGTIS